MSHALQAEDILSSATTSGRSVYYSSERGDRLIDLESLRDRLWQVFSRPHLLTLHVRFVYLWFHWMKLINWLHFLLTEIQFVRCPVKYFSGWSWVERNKGSYSTTFKMGMEIQQEPWGTSCTATYVNKLVADCWGLLHFVHIFLTIRFSHESFTNWVCSGSWGKLFCFFCICIKSVLPFFFFLVLILSLLRWQDAWKLVNENFGFDLRSWFFLLPPFYLNLFIVFLIFWLWSYLFTSR